MPKGGPLFPIAHALRSLRVAVALQAHMPAVHPEMTIFLAKTYFFCYLERHAKIQNRRQTPSGRKVSGRKEKERKNNAKFSGRYVRPRTHNVRAHVLCSDKFIQVCWIKTLYNKLHHIPAVQLCSCNLHR